MDSIVRKNLLTRPGYSPYCGATKCCHHWPRTRFDGQQFQCRCGWRSEFPVEFIREYVDVLRLREAAETIEDRIEASERSKYVGRDLLNLEFNI